MPHSTSDSIPNGATSPSSKTLSKLSSYPTVASGIDTFKSHPYGKKSLEIADDFYARFGKPAQAYLETPIEYIKPYANKADELGDKALGTIEAKLPIVKEQPQTIWESGKSWVLSPYTYGIDTWNDEYSKTSKQSKDQGFFTLVSALVSFNMRVASDAFSVVADWTKPRYEESKKTANEYVSAAQDKVGDAKKFAEDKFAEVKQNGEGVSKAAQEKGEQAKEQAKETKEQAEKSAKKSK